MWCPNSKVIDISTGTSQFGQISKRETRHEPMTNRSGTQHVSRVSPAQKIQPTVNILYHVAKHQGFIYYSGGLKQLKDAQILLCTWKVLRFTL